MASSEIEKLIKLVAKLPSLGNRSARKAVLQMLMKKDTLLMPLIESLTEVADKVKTCEVCGNFDTISPCSICSSVKRESGTICIVQDVADLWAMEKVSSFKGKYHVLGGVLSAIEGVAPEDLSIESLIDRIKTEEVKEIIFALPATIDGQITVHYLQNRLQDLNVKMSTLAQGIPVGAELDYMDEGTLQLALNSRKSI